MPNNIKSETVEQMCKYMQYNIIRINKIYNFGFLLYRITNF